MADNTALIISLFEKYSIDYWEEGKNVTIGWINTTCPLCEDSSNHMGVNIGSLQISCWKCGRKGSFAYLLSILTGYPKDAIKVEIEVFSSSLIVDSEQQIREILKTEEEEPEEKEVVFSGKLPKHMVSVETADFWLLEDYMHRRKIALSTLMNHNCGVCQVGKYMNRLIIPVYFEGDLVGFQAADLTGRAELKYKADTVKSLIKNYFYRWDEYNVNVGYLVVTEGVLDAWRLGGNVVASFGTSLSKIQKRRLINLRLKKLIFAFDGEAYLDTLRLSEEFSPFIDETFVVQFPGKEDPDSLGYEESWRLIREECNI